MKIQQKNLKRKPFVLFLLLTAHCYIWYMVPRHWHQQCSCFGISWNLLKKALNLQITLKVTGGEEEAQRRACFVLLCNSRLNLDFVLGNLSLSTIPGCLPAGQLSPGLPCSSPDLQCSYEEECCCGECAPLTFTCTTTIVVSSSSSLLLFSIKYMLINSFAFVCVFVACVWWSVGLAGHTACHHFPLFMSVLVFDRNGPECLAL